MPFQNVPIISPPLFLFVGTPQLVAPCAQRTNGVGIMQTDPKDAGQTEVGLVAHHSFLQAHPGLASPGDLKGRYVGDVELQRTLEVAASVGHPLQRGDFIFRSPSAVGQLQAIEAGIGVGALLTLFAPQRPQLRRLFPEVVSLPVSVWLCAHDDLRRSARIRRVFDHLAVAIRPLLAGEGFD